MQDEHDTREDRPRRTETDEGPGGHNDNPGASEGAGEKGAGSATGALGGLDGGSEPEGEDVRDHERP